MYKWACNKLSTYDRTIIIILRKLHNARTSKISPSHKSNYAVSDIIILYYHVLRSPPPPHNFICLHQYVVIDIKKYLKSDNRHYNTCVPPLSRYNFPVYSFSLSDYYVTGERTKSWYTKPYNTLISIYNKVTNRACGTHHTYTATIHLRCSIL